MFVFDKYDFSEGGTFIEMIQFLETVILNPILSDC